MSAATACRAGLAEAWWAGPVAWAFARAIVTTDLLEQARVALGRRSGWLGSLVTCVECTAAWVAAGPAVLVGLQLGPWSGVTCWAGAWGACLLLDAVLERLRR